MGIKHGGGEKNPETLLLEQASMERERGLPRELPGGQQTLEEKITIGNEDQTSRDPARPGAEPCFDRNGRRTVGPPR